VRRGQKNQVGRTETVIVDRDIMTHIILRLLYRFNFQGSRLYYYTNDKRLKTLLSIMDSVDSIREVKHAPLFGKIR
jgi:hypothetical protein